MRRAGVVVRSALSAIRRRALLVDGVAAAVLSALALAASSSSFGADVAFPAAVCALAATTSVAWRRRAPEAAVGVAGAGMVGYGWLAGSQGILFEAVALLLVMYSAGVRGVSRWRFARLAALVMYGIAIGVIAAAGIGSLDASTVFQYALPLAFAAVAGCLVARQRDLAERLATATARLHAEEQMRLAVATVRERNRVARELHDVVAHGVSVMVVQAGVARITLDAEPNLARAALREVATAGRAALAELRPIMGAMTIGDGDGAGPPFGIDGIVALAERRRAGGLAVRMTVTGGDPALPPAVDAAVYRLVQEALTNVVKHAPSADASVDITVEPGAVQVAVRNSPPDAPDVPAVFASAVASGHGLLGMRERVESCGGQLSYGPRPDGGFEVRARIPLAAASQDSRQSPRLVGRRLGSMIDRTRRFGPWPGVIAALCVLSIDACASPDRRGPLALNVGLAACLSLPLIWRRRAPFLFLVAVNLLALPISDGLTSINNPTLVSTFVFAVPVWTVAAWLTTGRAATGLAFAAGFDVGEALYWHFGIGSIIGNVLVAVLLWAAGRVVRSQRLLAADLARTYSLLETEQEARESLRLAAERTRMVAQLQSVVAERVSAMIVAAESVRTVIDADADASTVPIGAIEQTGRQALAELREVLGLLRADHDPERLSPLLGAEHLHDLIARYRESGAQATLAVSGVPVPLLGGADVLTYRVVEEVLAAAEPTAPCRSVGLRFGKDSFGNDSLSLDFVMTRCLGTWGHPDTRQQIQRVGGSITRSAAGAGERITVELPLAPVMAGQ
jgi:signal transduction histidine kinase